MSIDVDGSLPAGIFEGEDAATVGIRSNGHATGTTVEIDGKPLGVVTRVELVLDCKENQGLATAVLTIQGVPVVFSALMAQVDPPTTDERP